MTRCRVLLIWPGSEEGAFGCPQLVGLATYVRAQTGAEVEVVDLFAERCFGPVDLAKLARGRDGAGYDIVGLSCYSSFDFLKVEAIATRLRSLLPEAVFVAGGYHTSARPADFIFDGSVFDVAVIGEGELALTRVIDAFQGGTRLRETILPSEPLSNLEQMPETDWSFLDRYRPHVRRFASQLELYLSRGCPFDCAFCMERAKRETRWRAHTVDRAIDELRAAHRYFDFSGMTIYLADALFGMNKAWRREFLERLAAERFPAEKFWLLIRVDMVDAEDLRAFSAANCAIGYGLESGDPTHLATIRKSGRLTDYLERMTAVAAQSRELDLPWGANVIVGHPGETESTLRASARYLSELFLDPRGTTGFLSVDPFRLYPGSPIDDERADWEAKFGTTFHRPEWWKDGDQEFLAEWVDPSEGLTYLKRSALTAELMTPILTGIERNFRYRGGARDYFRRAIREQVNHQRPSRRLHFLGRYFAWNHYLGRDDVTEALAQDDATREVCERLREDRLALLDPYFDAGLDTPGRRALERAFIETRRELFAPVDFVSESVLDQSIPQNEERTATLSAMHAYVRTFSLLRVEPGMTVLDVGGGTGYGAALLERLVGPVGRVTMIELEPALAVKARALLRAETGVYEGDAFATGSELPDAPFDRIALGFAISEGHLPDLLRALAPKGLLVGPVETEEGQRLLRADADGNREWFESVYYVDERSGQPPRPVKHAAETEVPARKPSRRKLRVLAP